MRISLHRRVILYSTRSEDQLMPEPDSGHYAQAVRARFTILNYLGLALPASFPL